MKIIVGAIALAFAVAAGAQPVAQPPARDQHQHGQHQHGQHQPQEQHQQHQPGQHGQHRQGEHGEHRDGCCADRDGNGRMDCCDQAERQSGERSGCRGEHQARDGHHSH